MGLKHALESLVEPTPLVCPRCGGSHLHHVGVYIYSRREDAKETQLVTHWNTGTVTISTHLSGILTANPSPRRSGLRVAFSCEDCDAFDEGETEPSLLQLVIAQHKGETLVYWEVVEE